MSPQTPTLSDVVALLASAIGGLLAPLVDPIVNSLLMNLGRFLTELGRDFCYIGSEYPLQVGNQDFALGPLFFHRGLNCLVAIELKVGRFEPEYLGKFFLQL